MGYRAENPVLYKRNVPPNAAKKLLYIFPLGVLVGGAGVVEDGLVLRKGTDVAFFDVDHGADERDAAPRHMRNGREGGQPPLVEHGEEERLDEVVRVVAERQLIAAHLYGGIV